MPITIEDMQERYEDASKWIAAWTWIEGCSGLEVYIADDGLELRKFGVRVWAHTAIEAVRLALLEGWGYEQHKSL